MVKGISRQVIVVHAPEPKLFEQAIFILTEEAVAEGVADDVLLKEAGQAISDMHTRVGHPVLRCALWAGAGAIAVGLAWAVSVCF